MPATPLPAQPPTHEHTSYDLPASSPLQACPHCEALIDTTEREPLETISCPGCGSPLEMSGEIAGLQLIEVAGRGGMGVVYKAYDPGLDRHIAIKLLRKNSAVDSKLIEQLETEARITASITDQNVVRVYATGFDRGRFYLAMELVNKGSLDDLIHLQGRIAETQALEVGIQIASGLRAAFQHGLIHRDVKPGNILFDESRTAKIVDFGLAMFANQMEESSGEIWGTPYYVPPEKLDGGVEDLRSDIYSLGASLFHALAGRPPFEAENASLVALKHLKSQVVSLQAFAPWVSNATAHIINRTLAKNPADRFQSYDDLIHNLQYALDQLHQGGSQAPSRARVVLETDEDRKTWTWVVLGMVAVIAVLIGFLAFARPKSQQTAAVTRAPAKAPTAAPIEGFALKNEVNALANRDEKAVTLLDSAVGRNGPGEQRAWAQFLLATAHLSAGHKDEARAAFQKADVLADSVKDPDLSKFLKTVSERLSKTGAVPLAETQSFRRDNYEATGCLLYGLHNWQNGALEDGVAGLRQFRSSTINGSTAWLSELKPLAMYFVERYVSYQMAVEALKKANDTSDRSEAAKALRKIDPIFAKQVEAAIEPYAKDLSEFDKLASKLPEQALYRIYNKNSKLVLDVEGRRHDEGAKVHQWANCGGLNQIWELVPVSGNTFKLRVAHSGLLLNLRNSSTEPGAQMCQWGDDGTSAGLWKIEPQGDGWYFIRSACSNQVLAVDNMSKDDGGSVTQWDKPGTADHYWRFERIGVRLKDWCVMDMGGHKGPASTKIDGNNFTFTANNHDVWNAKDSCRFVYREAVGDFDFSAQLTQMNEIGDWTKVGIMVRNSISSSSRDIFFGFSGRKGVFYQRRLNDEGETSHKENSPREDLKGVGWIKLTRRGSTFTMYHSLDGNNWAEIAKEQIDFNGEAIVGLAASSADSGEVLNARFENVSLKKP